MYRRTLVAFAAACLLAACGSDDTSGSAAGTGGTSSAGMNAAPSTGVQSSNLGGAGSMGANGVGSLAQGVPDRVLFDTDTSALAPDARATLEAQAAWLKQNPRVAVQIAGNCDERGTEEYNLALGERRANTARDYLVSRGIDQNRIQTISFGKNRPTALGSDPGAWAQNRNAITSVHAPGA